MRIHQLPVAEALASVRSAASGLSSPEADRRLQEYGPNRVEEVRKPHRLTALLQEFTHFFSIVLWIAAGLAFIAERNAPGQGMARLGFAIIGVIVVSGLFSFWQEYRVEQAIAALRRLLPHEVEVLRDGAVARIAAARLVPGDVVLLKEGDRVPADCRLLEAFSVRVDNSTVTGESAAESRSAAPAATDDLLRAKNIVLAGTSIVSGRAKCVVFATGMTTEFGRIAHLAQASGDEVSPLRREVARLSRTILLIALVIGLVFFLLGKLLGIPFWEDVIFAIGLIVAMVPEGLLPTLTLALVLATQRMARRRVLIRHLPSVEALGSTTVICTDKTGTLTQNRMAVKAVFLDGNVHWDADVGLLLTAAQAHRPFFLVAALCHDLQASGTGESKIYSGDPAEQALVEFARRILPIEFSAARVDEIPFDTERMRLSVVFEMPEGRMLLCKGAPETVLPLCESGWRNGAPQPLLPDWRAAIVAAQERMADRGLRVLALACRTLQSDGKSVEGSLTFAGLAGLQDPPRPEVPDAIRTCRGAGIKVIMVTGDHPHTALAIAREIGLARSQEPLVLGGDQLRRLSATQLQLALDEPEVICARVAPEQKMRIVDTLKRKGHVVAVTGDGVNDAPALRSAHIGIAMGLTGTDVAKEAADMVLLDDNFASIVSAVEEGRAVFANIRKFLTYILAHNVAELIPYLGFVLVRIPLALTPLQMLAIDMGTDSLTAIGLGVERPDPGIMREPPRPPRERLFSLGLALRGYLALGLFEAVAAMATFFFVLRGGGWSFGEELAATAPLYLEATTGCLAAIVAMQVVNVFLCRSATRSVFATGIRGNRWILWGVVLEFVLILLFAYIPWLNGFLGTAPIPPEVWLFVIPFALAMIALEETRKALARRWRPSRKSLRPPRRSSR